LTPILKGGSGETNQHYNARVAVRRTDSTPLSQRIAVLATRSTAAALALPRRKHVIILRIDRLDPASPALDGIVIGIPT
jgi:hypothetical protein